jgi:hypothetical protein
MRQRDVYQMTGAVPGARSHAHFGPDQRLSFKMWHPAFLTCGNFTSKIPWHIVDHDNY